MLYASELIKIINTLIGVLFFLCYSYQFIYMAAALFKGKKSSHDYKLHSFAVLIAARNEEKVLPNLIESIKEQIYPGELITVFVVADNCTDGTAAAAKNAGAQVYERNNPDLVGKGYALDFLLKRIEEDYPENTFDGYFVFDADNILEPDYIYEMNRTFSQGYEIVTGYRNSKNFGDNWISAAYSIWFLHESQSLNKARYIFGECCNISGTGFVFSNEVIKKLGGWKFHLLTEDLEFTADNIIRGERIGYCETAMLYDEQPTSFKQSVRQRMRWAKGYLQVFGKYGKKLVSGVALKRDFSCYDMIMSIAPAFALSVVAGVLNTVGLLIGWGAPGALKEMLLSVAMGGLITYITFLVIGALTVISEWDRIKCSAPKKVLYTLTFPLFMFTYLPVAIAAVFARPQWKPIEHKHAVKLSQIK